MSDGLLYALAIAAVVVGWTLFIVSVVVRRRRVAPAKPERGLALVVETPLAEDQEPGPGDDLSAVVDAVATCGVRYVRGPGLIYVCGLAPHPDLLHSDAGVQWYADGDLDVSPKPAVQLTSIRIGSRLVCQVCAFARRDGHHDIVCAICRPYLVGSSSGLPR